jgi:pimeloyl-ACP methyl ester carboxylesterase
MNIRNQPVSQARLWGCLIAAGYFFMGGILMQAKVLPVPIVVNEYGDIVDREHRMIDSSIIERVMIYPKLCSKSQKRIVRSGVLYRYDGAVATILICHGFMCNKIDAGLLRTLFPRGKFNFLVFDFREHGELKGQCSCTLGRDEKYDVMAAARFLREYAALKGKPLLVYGFSMGAVAAIEAQAKDNKLFDAMILDCPFESSENLLRRSLDTIKCSFLGYEFSLPGRGLLQRYAFHPYVQSFLKVLLKAVAHLDPKQIDLQAYPVTPVESVKKITIPCFYILCRNDEKVSVDAMKIMFNNTASQYKVLRVTNGRGHFDSYFSDPEKYSEFVWQFVVQFLTGVPRVCCRRDIIEDEHDESKIVFCDPVNRKIKKV